MLFSLLKDAASQCSVDRLNATSIHIQTKKKEFFAPLKILLTRTTFAAFFFLGILYPVPESGTKWVCSMIKVLNSLPQTVVVFPEFFDYTTYDTPTNRIVYVTFNYRYAFIVLVLSPCLMATRFRITLNFSS